MRLNVNSRIIVVLLIVTGLAVSAGYCAAASSVDEFNNSASGDTRVEIAWLGPMPSNPDMSKALHKYFILGEPNQVATANSPLLIMGEHAAAQAESWSKIIQSYYDIGQLVILLDSSSAHLNAVLEELETKIPNQTGGSKRALWRAIKHDTGAARTYSHQVVIRTDDSNLNDIAKKVLERQAIYHGFENMIDRIRTKTDVTPQIQPNAEMLAKLITEPGKAVKLSQEQIDKLLNTDYEKTDASDILADLAYLYTNTQAFYVYYNDDLYYCDSDDSSCATTAASYPYAKYTIGSYGYTAHAYETNTDYWLFLLNLTLAQSTAMVENSSTHRYWFADIYESYNVLTFDTSGSADSSQCSKIWKRESSDSITIDTCASSQCSDAPNSDGLVPMVTEPGITFIESSPATTSDCVSDTVTTTTGSTISGTAGYKGNDGTAAVSDSISNETSNAYSTDAVCINNYSDTDEWDQVYVQFAITTPSISKNDWGCYKSIGSCSSDATGTFQPWVAWVWTTSDDTRTTATDNATGDDLTMQLCGCLQFRWNEYYIHGNGDCPSGHDHKIEAWMAGLLNYHLVITFPPNDQE